jgi:hypothetical protein
MSAAPFCYLILEQLITYVSVQFFGTISNPGRPASFYESEEAQRIMKRRSDLVLDYIGDDADKMIKWAWDFLAEAEKHVIAMNRNPETGEYEPVKTYKKSEQDFPNLG